MSDVDVIVVGAGVLGLASAREFASRGHDVIVLEQHAAAGLETSSRNSGVIHAGIYYPKDSLRARLCVRGKSMLYDFCAENGVVFDRCGKLLVATDDSEVPALKRLMEQARQNGVRDVTPLTQDDVRDLEPDINCRAACLSPSTGVIEAHGLMQALEGHIHAHGSQVVFDTVVQHIRQASAGFKVSYTSGIEPGSIRCRWLILAAGHGSSTLAGTLFNGQNYRPPETYPARGHYYRLDAQHRFHHLVYPMPSGAWLGTHLTLDTAGTVRFGPDNEWIDSVDYSFDDSTSRRHRFVSAIQRYYPALDPNVLVADYVGVRPKIYRQGESVADFAIHGSCAHRVDGLVALFGMESPGLTSCLAIAEYTANLLTGRI